MKVFISREMRYKPHLYGAKIAAVWQSFVGGELYLKAEGILFGG
jgi:hypothetical protein